MYQNIFITSRTEYEPATVYLWDDKKGLLTIPYTEFDYAYRRDSSGMDISLHGFRVKKTYRYRRDEEGLLESDLPRETRVLTDLYLDSDEPSTGHVVLFFDIEVSSKGGFPNLETADKEITSIAVYDSITEEYKTFTLANNKQFVGLQTIRGWEENYYSDEEDLLNAFLNYYEELSPTIITGWNSNRFDVPYLYRRLRRVMGDENACRLSPVQLVKYSQRQERYVIAGVSQLDYLEMYKKFTYTEQPNYRLDTIAEFELGEKKIKYDGTLQELYENNLAKFVEYNHIDVKLIVSIDKKKKLIELVRRICHTGHVPYEDYNMSSRFIEGTIVTYLHRKGIICPNKPIDGRTQMEERDNSDEDGFEGAYVKEPVPGLYEWVYSLDLQSLYPSIIMSLNISPETKAGRVYNWDVNKFLSNEVNSLTVEADRSTYKFDKDKFIEFMEDTRFTVSSNGILYDTNKKGIIPEILEEWFAKRKEYKDLMKKYAREGNVELEAYYDQLQHVQKIFLNSIYGVLGLPVFRFYDIDNALAVTSTGQDVIKTTAKYINSIYRKKLETDEDYNLYTDTDSCYFSAVPLMGNNDPMQFTIDIARQMESGLNSFYTVMAERMLFCKDHKFVIKGETVAKSGFWVAKKRYALLKTFDLEKNLTIEKITVKGLDVVRSSFPIAFKSFMNELLLEILNKKPKEVIDSKILEFVESIEKFDRLLIARNTSVKNLSKYDTVKTDDLVTFAKGTPMHVKSALTYNRFLKMLNLDKKYEPIMDGEKIKYVYLKDNPYKIDVIAIRGFGDPKEILDLVNNYTDAKALFESELKNKLDDFYTALGWGNIPTDVNQNALEFFTF
jgi:DNA polymerase elongation subunit (family B)